MAEILFERNGRVGLVTLDVSVSETHVSTALVTEHAVEDNGGNVSDNVRKENDKVRLSFVVSNTPITTPGSLADGAIGEVSAVTLITDAPPRRLEGNPVLVSSGSPPEVARVVGGGSGIAVRTPGNPPKFQGQELTGIQSAGGPGGDALVLQFDKEFDRVTAVYNVLRALQATGSIITLVTSLRTYENVVIESITKPRDVKNAGEFEVDVKQVRIVNTETVAAPEPEETRGEARRRRGGQSTEEASNEEASRGSLWYRLAGL